MSPKKQNTDYIGIGITSQPKKVLHIIVVSEIDDHYAQAVKAGATIVVEIKDEDYGGRAYSCRDPQGQLWNFGSYDPWRSES